MVRCGRACRSRFRWTQPRSDVSDTVVSFRDLTKSFAGMDTPALAAVTGEIRAGLITGLVGPDGAGKTTLLRLIAGLLVPSAGSLATLGRDPVHESAAIHREIGYMPQKFGLYEDLSVIENLTLHADLRNVTGAARVATFDRLLEFTDLQRFTGRFAGKLSGGMKQKLGLACALLGKPRLLLLDEPGVGVDPISRRELRAMVGRLVDEGIAVVWSTAYLDEAELCGTTLVLNEGKLIFSGRPEVMTAPLAGRCWQLKNPAGNKRRLLAQALVPPVYQRWHHPRPPPAADIPRWRAGHATGHAARSARRATRHRLGPGGAALRGRVHRPHGRWPGRRLSVLASHVRAIPADGEVVIEAQTPHQAIRRFHRHRRGHLPGPARRDLRLARTERRGQIHHLQDDVRLAQAHRGPGRRRRPRPAPQRRARRARNSATWRRNSRSTAI